MLSCSDKLVLVLQQRVSSVTVFTISKPVSMSGIKLHIVLPCRCLLCLPLFSYVCFNRAVLQKKKKKIQHGNPILTPCGGLCISVGKGQKRDSWWRPFSRVFFHSHGWEAALPHIKLVFRWQTNSKITNGSLRELKKPLAWNTPLFVSK